MAKSIKMKVGAPGLRFDKGLEFRAYYSGYQMSYIPLRRTLALGNHGTTVYCGHAATLISNYTNNSLNNDFRTCKHSFPNDT